jgi:hypothetical protein
MPAVKKRLFCHNPKYSIDFFPFFLMQRSAESMVRIFVTPVNTTLPPSFPQHAVTVSVEENVARHTVLVDLNATQAGAVEGETGTIR